MILKVFSIFDSATKAFNQPFYMLTQAEAIRAFTNMALDPETNINKHPHDYRLFALGKWDNSSGEFTNEIYDLGSAAVYQVNETNVEKLFPSREVENS